MESGPDNSIRIGKDRVVSVRNVGFSGGEDRTLGPGLERIGEQSYRRSRSGSPWIPRRQGEEMLLHGSAEPREEFDALMADSALAAIVHDAPLMQIEAALRSLGEMMAKADPLRRAIVREETIRRLRGAGVGSPAAMADTAFGPLESAGLNRIRLGAVAPWNETVDGRELLEDIAKTVQRFVVLPAVAADAQALWCLNTYAHEAAGVSPILCIGSSEKRCGKTRNLEVLSCLAHRPLHTSNITVAALYRTIDRYRPTLLSDEADTIFVNGSNAELRGVLNAGLYKSNAFVLRCGERQEPKMHSVWCPKAIALIGRLPTTLEDRSIVIGLRRRSRSEPVETFRYDKSSRSEGKRRVGQRITETP